MANGCPRCRPPLRFALGRSGKERFRLGRKRPRFTFGVYVVNKFLNKHDLDLICRAHQVVEDGYEFFAKRQLVALFSAPNYCGDFDNAGGMMSVDEMLLCSFQILKPSEKKAMYSYHGMTNTRPTTPPRTKK
ncbi:unnamed protein product [Oikopleura dioica]|uniref:protein-serine/threonine phosphatase n=1 Tax=Oikopleura dioica TaxID=34765 RepID=E4XXU1_OIKDI|nr:unnamed protein product [Oikopleura dioica]